MKCSNCSIKISQEFAFALKNNLCPACGKPILPGGRLECFVEIKDLIQKYFQEYSQDNISVEDIATLIVSSFDVRKTKNNEKTTEQIEEDNTEDNALVDGVFLEKQTPEKLKAQRDILKKMRDAALQDAIEERYGPMTDGLTLDNIDIDPSSFSRVLEQDQKKELAREAVLNGSTGSKGFRRSG